MTSAAPVSFTERARAAAAARLRRHQLREAGQLQQALQGRFGAVGTPSAHLSADGRVVLQVEGLLFAFDDRSQEQFALLTWAGWCVVQDLADVGEALETARAAAEVALRPLDGWS